MRQFEFFILVAVGNLKYIYSYDSYYIYTFYGLSACRQNITKPLATHLSLIGYYNVCYFDHHHTPSGATSHLGYSRKNPNKHGRFVNFKICHFTAFFKNFLEKKSFHPENSENFCWNLENSKDLGDKVKNQVKI